MIAKYTCIRCHKKIKEEAWLHYDKIELALCKECTIKSVMQWESDLLAAINIPSAAIAALGKRANGLAGRTKGKIVRNHNPAMPTLSLERMFAMAKSVWQKTII
jgi:NAD-dependent SIR2 family protein deacetylase